MTNETDTLRHLIERANATIAELRAAVHYAELARRIEAGNINIVDTMQADEITELRVAARARIDAEQAVADAVAAARGRGRSWNLIGTALGVSGEAVRSRYGKES